MLQGQRSVVGVRQDPQDLIKLALGGRLVAGLRVLDDEDHHDRDRGHQRLKGPLPQVRETERDTEADPRQARGQHADRRQGMPCPVVYPPEQPAALRPSLASGRGEFGPAGSGAGVPLVRCTHQCLSDLVVPAVSGQQALSPAR
jgi:hypothetical protein